MKARTIVLARITVIDWECERRTVRSTYVDKSSTRVEYAPLDWRPWMSESSLEKLETAELAEGRKTAGPVKNNSKEFIIDGV